MTDAVEAVGFLGHLAVGNEMCVGGSIVAGRITHNTYECAPGESRVDVRLFVQLKQEHTRSTDIIAPGGMHACARVGQFRRRSLKVTTSGNS